MVGTDDYMLEYDNSSMNEERENTVGGGGGGGGGVAGGVEGIWVGNEQQQQQPPEDDDLLLIDFPPLISDPLPCMSSSSSSTSSTPAPAPAPPTKHILSTSSSSSATSWAVNKSEAEEHRPDPNHPLHAQDYTQHFAPAAAAAPAPAPGTLSSPATEHNGGIDNMNCMDDYVMENFSFMDLMDNEWDPSCSILQQIDKSSTGEDEEKTHLPPNQNQNQNHQNNGDDGVNRMQPGEGEEEEEEGPLGDLGEVLLEWLKSNKEHISAEEMRNIKLRKATIECASKTLGTSREGRKQLLKLILEWVEHYHLQKRRIPQESDPSPAAAAAAPHEMPFDQTHHQLITHFPNPPAYPNHDIVPCFPAPSPWLPPHQPYGGGGTYMADPNSNILNHSQMWPPPPAQFIPNSNGCFAVGMGGGHGGEKNQQQYYSYPLHYRGERLTRPCSSATKEARQKRMARQKRIFRHNNNHHYHHQQQQQQNLAVDNFTNVSQVPADSTVPNGSGVPSPLQHAEADQQNSTQKQKQPMAVDEQKQEWKNEKNLKFLLQKVLKQSDVGSMGRIVLPKKEAEAHLPELETRDGITLAMEDLGTSRVWKMRFRYWPNNKSRMYLLENTGEFVRANGLQEGDFIVIYSDVKCGKYLIRGVKVPV